jgi:hypothetical protein
MLIFFIQLSDVYNNLGLDGSRRHVVSGNLTVSSDDTPILRSDNEILRVFFSFLLNTRLLNTLTGLPKSRDVCSVTVQVECLRWRRSFNGHKVFIL